MLQESAVKIPLHSPWVTLNLTWTEKCKNTVEDQKKDIFQKEKTEQGNPLEIHTNQT